VISITDGQIYLEADLFNAGIRPAINVGISVKSRRRQRTNQSHAPSGGLAAFGYGAVSRISQPFAQFGSDQLDKATQAQLARGQRLTGSPETGSITSR